MMPMLLLPLLLLQLLAAAVAHLSTTICFLETDLFNSPSGCSASFFVHALNLKWLVMMLARAAAVAAAAAAGEGAAAGQQQGQHPWQQHGEWKELQKQSRHHQMQPQQKPTEAAIDTCCRLSANAQSEN